MRKITVLDRILLLATGLLAAYQIVFGVEDLHTLPMVCYTLAFGVLLVAGLLLIILGFEILDSPWVALTATLIPLSLSLGLVWQYLPACRILYLVFALVGFAAVAYTRLSKVGKLATIVLAFVHGVAGMLIFLLPFYASLVGWTSKGFIWVGVGGALIGIGGLLLSFLKAGKPILPRATIMMLLPGLLLLMMAAFLAGFALA